jgi:glutaconyl-CoA/methylmalonyl-CoA decarboxylase subunit gamma
MTKHYKVTVNGSVYDVTLETDAAAAPAAASVAAPAPAHAAAPAPVAPAAPVAGTEITSPLPGTVLSVNVSDGQAVKSGDVLFVLEAMKMENEIMAPSDGTVASISVAKGAAVDPGTLLCVIQ